MATGGSIEEVSFAGRSFAVASDAEAQVKIGGFENEVQNNGNGTARQIKNRVPWSITGLALEISHADGDLEFLQERADGKLFEVFTITLADETVYQGTAQITGELQGSTQSATATVNFQGPKKLTIQ